MVYILINYFIFFILSSCLVRPNFLGQEPNFLGQEPNFLGQEPNFLGHLNVTS